MKKLRPHSTFKTDMIKVGLVFSISNFFINKSSLANKWMSFSFRNSALDPARLIDTYTSVRKLLPRILNEKPHDNFQ